MIVGVEECQAAKHFIELDDAIRALQSEKGDQRVFALNSHAFPDQIPDGALVLNYENVGIQVSTDMFEGREVYDFSEKNCKLWDLAGRKVTHFPLGYHPTMERFTMLPWDDRDIDVVFCGVMNERRVQILDAIAERGFQVAGMPPGYYGNDRDSVFARSKLALAVMYYPDGVYCTQRAAHLAANKLPFVSEIAPDTPAWVPSSMPYERIVDAVCEWLEHPEMLQELAERTYESFKRHPMTLPEPGDQMSLKRVLGVFGGIGATLVPTSSPGVAIPGPAEASPKDRGKADHVSAGSLANDPFDDPRWAMLHDKEPAEWDLADMYDWARGKPVSSEPLPAIIVPSYRETEHIAQRSRMSRNAVRSELAEHDIESLVAPIHGDSLVCRMRQRACHLFLMSAATHLLFWDCDIECVTPSCVREMMATGHDIIAGACPFKAPGGRTVHNLYDDTPPKVGADGCVEVRDAGTGFMMISRKALLRLQHAHPELLHWSMSTDKDRGAPLWALFDTGIVDGVYQSEDFMFCRLWQALGEKVYVYTPARFRHWGEYGYEGSFMEQYGLV